MPVLRNTRIGDAQNIQRQTGHDVVIVLAFNPGDGQMEYASYGRDKAMCQIGQAVGDAMFNTIERMFADAALPRQEGR